MSDLQPASPGSPDIRASDAERDLVVSVLREHCSLGRITLDEFADRTNIALAARTRADLEALTRDLPTVAQPPQPVRTRKPRRWTVAFMSGASARRRWRLSERTNAIAFMGGVRIDLREAEVEGPHAEILAVAFMGAVEIIVPEGMDVELAGFAFMGGKDVRVAGAPVAGMPALTVRAYSFMGGVTVRSRPRLPRS
jgi:hypothetical protein